MTAVVRPRGDAVRSGASRSAAVARVIEDLDRARELASGADRPDLVGRLDQARARLLTEDVPVAVVGEFKQGKSTLINALLRTDVCPVDSDIVTAVPTIVRYGVPPSVVAVPEPTDGTSDPQRIEVPFDRLRDYVTEAGQDAVRLRSVEVRLDRLLLRRGLSFIDTPGVGGLESAQGNLTLGALPLARAALFVTDAGAELTAPELSFLTRTVERCPRVVCVVTKTDLHAQWRRIVALNQEHLARAGLTLPVLPVSSFLRLRAAARNNAALNTESGFLPLLDLLRRDILAGTEAATVRATRADIAFVVAQLRHQVGAERAAIQHPEDGTALADRLTEQARRGRHLAGSSASWQTALGDGIQDLGTDVDHDLRERLRGMLRRGEELLDTEDPKDNWRDFEAWASREAAAAAVDNLFTLVSRTEQLARDVAERFDLEYDGLDLDLPAPAAALAKVEVVDVRFERSSIRQFLGAFTAARLAYGGMFMAGAFGSLLGLTVAAPIGVAVGMTLGRKLVRDERERQLAYRRQQAKQELRRYVDEVGFVLGKDCRDAIRRTQRFLRDEFTARAALAERSSAQALSAVRQNAALPDDERARRAERLEEQWRDLDRAAERIAVPAGPVASPEQRRGAPT
ncbi:dynamin family protein [Plantactinospora solaniradicis]|uniref:Dynamin family protein n=1 Tax=Plantactinospora solaniradicis TaxID=1723736 RepID=A0ABW1K540_9ACTN